MSRYLGESALMKNFGEGVCGFWITAVLICLEKALMKRKINFWKFEFSRSPLCGRVLRVALPGKDQWLVEVGDAHSWKLGKRVM